MSKQALPWLSFLDGLRPDPGWQVDVAVLTTYSADCASIVAAMLALAGRDDDRGSGSKVDFAEAFEHLNGRFHVLLQSGRLAVPKKRLPVLRLLDRFVVPVEADERQHSWHPKLALLRLVNPDEMLPQWRLWVSSRNLTRDRSLDTGLLMVGAVHGKGARLKGVEEVGRRLFARAKHDAATVADWADELANVAWLAPEGITPIEIRLPGPADSRDFPAVPNNASEIVVVSPFLDVATVKYFGGSGRQDARRILVSSSPELMKLSSRKGDALQGYVSKLQFEAPPLDAGDPGYMAMELAADEQDDEERQEEGLHAKILMAKTGDSWMTWIGSTNATERGWKKNHELVLLLECTQRVADSLFYQFGLANGFDPEVIDGAILQEDETEQRLERARTQLLNEWMPGLRYVAESEALEARAVPPITKDIYLEVGWLGGARQEWPRNSVSLPMPHGPEEGDSQLFEFALRLGEQTCNWVQRIDWELPEDRDMRLMARFLDHRTFMQWLRDQLTQQALTDGGGDWDGEPLRRHQRKAAVGRGNLSWMPTLEEVLKASVQQPDVLASIDRKLRAYLAHVPDDIPGDDLALLKEFEGVWRLIRRELVKQS